MIVKLLTENYLEFLSLKGGCTGSSESTLVKMPHCWKSHVTAQLLSEYSVTVCMMPCHFQQLSWHFIVYYCSSTPGGISEYDLFLFHLSHVRIQRGGGQGVPTHLEISQKYRVS